MSAAAALAIRPAREADLPAIVALLADDPLGAMREENADPLPQAYLAAFRDLAAQRDNVLLVAETAGEIVGCVQFTAIAGLARRGMKRGQIEGVRVASGWRGRGVGEKLIRYAIDRARDEGCGLLQLTTDNTRPDAHRFYETLGFVASHVGMKLMLK